MLGSIASIISIASGVNSIFGGGGGGGGGGGNENVTQAADPLAPFRANLASMYAGYLQPGANVDVTSMPGYSAYKTGIMDPALETSKRSAAASGQLYSGGEQVALQDVAKRGYYGFMTDYLNRLAQGSGATIAPAGAVGLGLNAAQSGYQALGQGIGGLGNLFGGSGSGDRYRGGSNMGDIFTGPANYSGGSDGFA